ncbi:hypothetical protein COO60DRAFT_1698393 [Scenedesmus sp. NREL 46B-D3]|nr:hypothetical protein COO60DRAFT_1698393 [Scenedesmus sp. NREL 46B-D3]
MAIRFTWQELEEAIQDRNAPLGAGGFGTVYRGCLRGGTQVAIKVLDPNSQQGQAEFDNELRILGSLHHRHLLPLLGSCPERRALVYDFMEGGSLQDCLRLLPRAPAGPAGAAPLPWCDRVRICNEIVQGLIWLHTQHPPILHMDLKTANVLLDRDGTAKLGDISFARDLNGGGDSGHISYMQSSVLRGTIGYMAPEYIQAGVIMSELLTGKAAREAISAVEEFAEDTRDASEAEGAAALQPLLDQSAAWPVAAAAKFVGLAAACLRTQRRRPGLQRDLQPALQDMVAAAAAAAAAAEAAAQAAAAQKAAVAAVAAAAAAPAQQNLAAVFGDPESSLPNAGAGSAVPAAAGIPLAAVQPDPRWHELLGAAKARSESAAAWQAFGLCFRGCIEIHLCNEAIHDAGATALAQHAAQHWRNLHMLDLSQNTINTAGATALAQHAAQHWPNLQSLDLAWNKIGDAGATALAQHAAQHWPNLQSLNLGYNNIGDAGATALAQHAAQHWPNLQSSKLGCNTIGDAGATALAQHAAQHWPNLQSLDLGDNMVGDAGDNKIGDAGATALAQHAAQHWPNLQRLSLHLNKIGDAGATALAQHAAQHWPNLQSLYLNGNTMTAAGATALAQHAAQHWPNLQRLELGHNTIGDAGATALAQHAAQHWPNLQRLELGHNTTGDAGATALAQHAAQHWPNLQSLSLYDNKIGDAGATALAQHAAQHWPNLQKLHLWTNTIGDAGATALAQHAAQHWPNLQSLILYDNWIGPPPLGDGGGGGGGEDGGSGGAGGQGASGGAVGWVWVPAEQLGRQLMQQLPGTALELQVRPPAWY